MLFGKKKKSSKESPIDADAKDVTEYFEVIQGIVECIIESRSNKNLQSSAVHQIAYFLLITRILQKIKMVSCTDKAAILSRYSFRLDKDMKEAYFTVIPQFEKLFDACFEDAQFGVALQRYAYSVEMYMDQNANDKYLLDSIDCVTSNVIFVINHLKDTI